MVFKVFRKAGTLIILSGIITFSSWGCDSQTTFVELSPNATPSVSPSPEEQSSPDNSADSYEKAIQIAADLITKGNGLLSKNEMQNVANRWQEAIELLESVPASSPNYTKAQAKLPVFRSLLEKTLQRQPSASASTYSPTNIPSQETNPASFQVPIKRRMGGIPIIDVTFNGVPAFEMALDTGATNTLITQRMANDLQLASVGTVSATIADGSVVNLSTAYLNSIQVQNRVKTDVQVAIAPSMSVGLLGQDFFEGYDITIRENTIEFTRR